MLIFPCTRSMGLEGENKSVLRVIHKSKDKQMWLNSAKCEPAVTVIPHTFSGTNFCVNCVLDTGVTRLSRFPINTQNKFRSTMERVMYASTHRLIVSSLNCNWLHKLGSHNFLKCENACMIPFEKVDIFSILTSFQTVPLWPTLAASVFKISNKLELTWGCELVRRLCRFEVLFPSVVLLKIPLLMDEGGKGSFL